jgi:hypothetical protein
MSLEDFQYRQGFWPTPPLAAAISALRARGQGTTEFRKVASFYVDLAGRNLRHAIEADKQGFKRSANLITSNLLAWLGYSGSMEERDASYYFKLAYSLVLWDGNDTPCFEIEIPFIFALDCGNAWLTRNGGIPPRQTTFSQRVQYFEQFMPSFFPGDVDEPRYPSLLEAANSTLGNLMEVVLGWTSRFSKSEFMGAVDRAQLNQVLLYIRSELGDPDLHAALQVLYKSFQGPNTNHTTVEGQLITRLFHRLRSVLFLHAVLSAPSILEIFQHPDVALIAKKIIYFCHKQVIRRGGPIEDYFLLSWHNFSYLLLGGIGLQLGDCPRTGMDVDRWR